MNQILAAVLAVLVSHIVLVTVVGNVMIILIVLIVNQYATTGLV